MATPTGSSCGRKRATRRSKSRAAWSHQQEVVVGGRERQEEVSLELMATPTGSSCRRKRATARSKSRAAWSHQQEVVVGGRERQEEVSLELHGHTNRK